MVNAQAALESHWLACPHRDPAACCSCRASKNAKRWRRRFLIAEGRLDLGSWLCFEAKGTGSQVFAGCAICKHKGPFGRFEITGKSLQDFVFERHAETFSHRVLVSRLVGLPSVPGRTLAPQTSRKSLMRSARCGYELRS